MSALRIHRCFPGTTPALLHRTTSPHSIPSLTLLRITPKPLHYSRLYATSTETPHPWPEWVSFVDRLKSRGYFPQSSRGLDHADLVYREFNLLKDPCLSFARDRFDIFKSLSKDDIQNVVEVGCPKIVRKVINSAKRLRVYVGLEEKTVCETCTLRGSCDRAYLQPNESENVRTVDIMRVLMFYALDPMLISGAVRPASIEQAESSARKLLNMLMDLSEASNYPASAELPYKKEKIVNSTSTVQSEDTERWNGEWVCPKCSFLNFSRNIICRKCNEDGPMKQESALVEPKKREREHAQPKNGDWHCPQCNFLNFTRNMQCRKCNEDAPEKRATSGHVLPKKGDWNCRQCGFANFARRTNCLQCTATRPPESLKPGEWVCSKCYFLNFRRNAACLKCDSKQAIDAAAIHENHIWTKPTTSATV